ncbi:MAG: septum site-determining protein Ssd [Nocardioides sp.]
MLTSRKSPGGSPDNSPVASHPHPPLFVTTDEALIEELSRLAAAADVVPEVVGDTTSALRSWSTAPLVLVGVDIASELARTGPPRRDRVLLVAIGQVPDLTFRTAMELGAEDVSSLPRSDAWLVETMTDLYEAQAGNGVTVGVVGGSGGAGATTFACALGQLAATRHGGSLVIDTDPLGPGIDRVLGLESKEGIRWDALQRTTGRLSARSLREAVPSVDGVGALTWSPGPQGSLQAFAVREAVSAAARGHRTVILDLARHGDPLIEELATRCDRVVVLVKPDLTGVASALRVCDRMAAAAKLGLVVHGSGVDPHEIAALADAPVLAAMNSQRGLAEAVALGAGPLASRRGPLARAARDVLAHLRANQ